MTILLYIAVALVIIGLGWRLVSNRHSIPCPAWLGWLVELDNPLARAARAREIIDHLDLEPGMTVLDFGCGTGRVSLPLARRLGPGGRLVAADMQQGMLARTAARLQAEGLDNVELLLAAAGEDKLGDARFDRVLLVSVLGEIPDRETAMAQLYRALKPGGILSVTETLFDPHYQTRSAVTRLATAAGFVEEAAYGNTLAYTLHLVRPDLLH